MSPIIEEGAGTISICVLVGSTESCRSLHRSGYSIYWHFFVIIVATRGYSMGFFTVVCK